MSDDPPTIERVIPLTNVRDYEYSRPTPSTDRLDDRVRVVVTPALYMVEWGLSPSGTDEFTTTRHLSPGEARSLAEQLRSGEAARLVEKLGADHADVVAADLDAAANVASTQSLGEVVGDEVISAYKEGKITEEEFVHEYGREADKVLDERDAE